MNEFEFKGRWESEKPVYRAWGNYVLSYISSSLDAEGKNLDVFFKIPPKSRLKSNESLLDKAFYRPGKSYKNPYGEIEDKVGVRFVVLLLEDIEEICKLIERTEFWVFDRCRHFEEDREKNPLLFTYQSVHYVLRPRDDMSCDGLTVSSSTACEVQIRTLLQHAHAELTHDAIYKARKTIQPKVHRTVARSMALIETADDYFKEVVQQLSYGPVEKFNITERLDDLYFALTGLRAVPQKSSIAIWDEFEKFVNKNLVGNIQIFVQDNPVLKEAIVSKYNEHTFYRQSVVLFVYWLLKKKRSRLFSDWPLQKSLLDLLAVDLGVSTQND